MERDGLLARTRWEWRNRRQLMPTANIRRGPGIPTPLETTFVDLGTVGVKDGSGGLMTVTEALERAMADGFLVLHKGRIVYEQYFGGLRQEDPHMLASGSKSFVGTVATLLLHERVLDANQTAAIYIPELSRTGFGTATVQELLDMTTVVAYGDDPFVDEMPSNPVLLRAVQMHDLDEDGRERWPRPLDYDGPSDAYSALLTARSVGEYGTKFRYDGGNTMTLQWVMERVTGVSFAELFSDRIWSRIGAEEDAYCFVDSAHSPFFSGGVSVTLRDWTRFGEMLRRDGAVGNRQVIPGAVVAEIRKGGNREVFDRSPRGEIRPGYTYHNQFWITHDAQGAFEAHGMNEQRLHVAPGAQLVAAQMSCDRANAGYALVDRVLEAIIRALST
jgi:CubicO group peptidase (beta-lactamase class C family)